MTRIVGIIPARMASSRFAGKPLALIHGKPMIEHVYHRSKMCNQLEEVFVATCDKEIKVAVEAFGGKVKCRERRRQAEAYRTFVERFQGS